MILKRFFLLFFYFLTFYSLEATLDATILYFALCLKLVYTFRIHLLLFLLSPRFIQSCSHSGSNILPQLERTMMRNRSSEEVAKRLSLLRDLPTYFLLVFSFPSSQFSFVFILLFFFVFFLFFVHNFLLFSVFFHHSSLRFLFFLCTSFSIIFLFPFITVHCALFSFFVHHFILFFSFPSSQFIAYSFLSLYVIFFHLPHSRHSTHSCF